MMHRRRKGHAIRLVIMIHHSETEAPGWLSANKCIPRRGNIGKY